MFQPKRLDGIADDLACGLAAGRTRRSFLGRIGAGVLALTGGRLVAAAVAPPTAEAYFGFCGHTWTTGSCPGPSHLPRIDRHGLPLRVRDGRAIDNLGRLVDVHGRPVDEHGRRRRGPDGELLARAPRTRICEDWTVELYGLAARREGSWYRCCSGQIRKLVDCCAASATRINGDAALHGYCYGDRNVFCVTYYDSGLPC